jgi:hypothetical protein
MTDVPVSYINADKRGTPLFEALDPAVNTNLLAGSEPGLTSPQRILLGDSLALAQFTVVGLSGGKLVAADATSGSEIEPIGVLLHAATSGAANTTVYGEVLLTGNFNADADSPLVWDASFTTLALKTGSVVGNPNLVFRSRAATGSAGV